MVHGILSALVESTVISDLNGFTQRIWGCVAFMRASISKSPTKCYFTSARISYKCTSHQMTRMDDQSHSFAVLQLKIHNLKLSNIVKTRTTTNTRNDI